MDIQEMHDTSAEMAELDLDLPFRTFRAVLEKSDISDETRETILSGLSEQFEEFRAGQNNYYRKVYNLA